MRQRKKMTNSLSIYECIHISLTHTHQEESKSLSQPFSNFPVYHEHFHLQTSSVGELKKSNTYLTNVYCSLYIQGWSSRLGYLPKGGTIRLKTRAMQTKTAGRTIYKQALGGEGTTGEKKTVRNLHSDEGHRQGPWLNSTNTFLAAGRQRSLKIIPFPP